MLDNWFSRFSKNFTHVLDKGFELELSWVSAKNPKHSKVPKDVASAAEEAAKQALADSDSEDDM